MIVKKIPVSVIIKILNNERSWHDYTNHNQYINASYRRPKHMNVYKQYPNVKYIRNKPPNTYDDLKADIDIRSWKGRRKTQYKQ